MDVSGSGENKRKAGGFMAVYHDIEEFCYGPECGFSAKERVFYCLRHKLLRDGLCEKMIGKAYIMEKTGLSLSQVKASLSALEKAEIILVHRSKTGKTWNESQYQLNPKKFGALYNWYKNNTTVRVHSSEGVGSASALGVGSYSALGVVPDSTLGKTVTLAELLKKLRSKNPIKEPIRKEPRENLDLLAFREPKPEDYEREKVRQLREARKAGIL